MKKLLLIPLTVVLVLGAAASALGDLSGHVDREERARAGKRRRDRFLAGPGRRRENQKPAHDERRQTGEGRSH